MANLQLNEMNKKSNKLNENIRRECALQTHVHILTEPVSLLISPLPSTKEPSLRLMEFGLFEFSRDFRAKIRFAGALFSNSQSPVSSFPLVFHGKAWEYVNHWKTVWFPSHMQSVLSKPQTIVELIDTWIYLHFTTKLNSSKSKSMAFGLSVGFYP